jgi:hypothetical protein
MMSWKTRCWLKRFGMRMRCFSGATTMMSRNTGRWSTNCTSRGIQSPINFSGNSVTHQLLGRSNWPGHRLSKPRGGSRPNSPRRSSRVRDLLTGEVERFAPSRPPLGRWLGAPGGSALQAKSSWRCQLMSGLPAPVAYRKAVRAASLPWNQRLAQRAAASTSKLDRPAARTNGLAMRRQPFPYGPKLYATLTCLLRSDSDLQAMPGLGRFRFRAPSVRACTAPRPRAGLGLKRLSLFEDDGDRSRAAMHVMSSQATTCGTDFRGYYGLD